MKWLIFFLALSFSTLLYLGLKNYNSRSETVYRDNKFQESGSSIQYSRQMEEGADTQVITRKSKTKGESKCPNGKSSEILNDYWFHNTHSDWTKLLDEGYDLDDLTYLIEEYGGDALASDFRVSALSKYTDSYRNNKTLKSDFLSLFPELSVIKDSLSIYRKSPSIDFDELKKYNKSERDEIYLDKDISINDIAYYIKNRRVEDKYIIEMLDTLGDINTPVIRGHIASINILDYAVESNRSDVVNYLLSREKTLVPDEYLASPMEWALRNLMLNIGTPLEISNIEIIKKLVAYGSPARFEKKSYNGISGKSTNMYYHFDSDDIEYLIHKFNLDLTALITREPFQEDISETLLLRLEEEKNNFYEENSDVLAKICNKPIP